ncbi:MAG: 4Fe-4S dicluster domain-containing protein, partial [Burkholderiaceae bacterium]
MQTQLAPAFANTADGQAAEAILRKCVHCGFCTATCPTYQLLGDELDGPRGRIYLIKQVLEGAPATASTQQHLDRCLTCRNCETTCPSGVHYGELVDIGRRVVDAQVPRVWWQRALRAALVHG